MKRYSTHTLEEIFNLMQPYAPKTVTSEGFRLKVTSDRLRLFKEKGIECVSCDLVGAYFALEAVRDETPHLNLYALNEKGQEVLMTKDHIFPRSLGGANELSNYQPMCTICNGKKSNKVA